VAELITPHYFLYPAFVALDAAGHCACHVMPLGVQASPPMRACDARS
jgi:hypothetical protein